MIDIAPPTQLSLASGVSVGVQAQARRRVVHRELKIQQDGAGRRRNFLRRDP